jgi:hypothetical protein
MKYNNIVFLKEKTYISKFGKNIRKETKLRHLKQVNKEK